MIVVTSAIVAAIVVARLDWSRVTPSLGYLAMSLGRSWMLAVLALLAGGAAAIPLV